MGVQLIEKMLPALEKMEWPQSLEASEQGRQAYMVGLERLDEYNGDVKMLSAALRTFQTGGSRPYACAGVAYTLVIASQESDGSFAPQGLDEAMKWLEQAQESAPDILEINVIESLVYTGYGRYSDARLVLDYLQEDDPHNYQLLKAELAYWKRQEDVDTAVYWFNKTAEAADNVPQRLRTRVKLADYYLEHGLLDEALPIYKEAVHFDHNNVVLWHKISMIYWQQENFEEAERSNQQLLRLQPDYAPAIKLHEALKKKKSEGSRLGKLFG